MGVRGWDPENRHVFKGGFRFLGGSCPAPGERRRLICFRPVQGCTLDFRELLFPRARSMASYHGIEGYTGFFTRTAAAFFAISGREPPAGSGLGG